ncbi:MAG: type II toxin-antitoxin system VapC family toxin [Candidatus Bathyarchaeia archaeon]|jgi:predicted nucleic acid-binding protein
MAQAKHYVDVNLFVYWLSKNPTFGNVAHKWINNIESSPPGEYLTSSLSLYEALVSLAGLADKTLKDEAFTENIIKAIIGTKGLIIEPLKPEDYAKALDLMGEYRLDYEDSIHLAVAMRMGIGEVISNDRHFDRTPLKRVF